MRFSSVYVREECGIADATGFHLYETHRYSFSGFPFSACRIDGRQIAVFAEMAVPLEDRPGLMSRKPAWLDAIVYARVLSDPRAEVAVLEAQVSNADDAELNHCAFAAACVAYGAGLFKVTPRSYVIRFEARASARVRIQFDADAESWFGDAEVDFGDKR